VRGVAVEDFQVLPIAGGDHSAIVVDIEVPVVALDVPAAQRAPAIHSPA
jgi:hypothetical protein